MSAISSKIQVLVISCSYYSTYLETKCSIFAANAKFDHLKGQKMKKKKPNKGIRETKKHINVDRKYKDGLKVIVTTNIEWKKL